MPKRKLYNVEQHKFSGNCKLKVEFYYKDITSPYFTSHVIGFKEVLQELSGWDITLDLDKMFEIFIDNKASKHIILILDDEGEVFTTLKILKEER